VVEEGVGICADVRRTGRDFDLELSLGTVPRTAEQVKHAEGTDTYVEAAVPFRAGVRFHPVVPCGGGIVPYVSLSIGPYWVGDVVSTEWATGDHTSVDFETRFGGYVGGGADFMVTGMGRPPFPVAVAPHTFRHANPMESPMRSFIRIVPILLAAGTAACRPETYDILIEDGVVIDGTGSPGTPADVGIRNGRIAAVGDLSGARAERRIDAAGSVVAPGFIDMLGQSELTILVNPHLPSKIFQGITTEITGEGGSIAPLNDRIIEADRVGYEHYGIEPDWRTLDAYFQRIERQGMGINLATYVGATQVRRVVLGDDDVQPTPAQLDSMKALVEAAMLEGAVGVSTSLQYAPAPYATTEELIALASVASRYGGVYATHMRSEGSAVLTALDEAIRIGREADIPVEIWHIKAAGTPNWGRMPEIVAKVEEARSSGLDITADTYAYTAWFNSLSAFVPPWAHDGGTEKLLERLQDDATRARIRRDMLTPSHDWDNEWQEIPGPEAVLVSVVQNPELREIQGRTLAEIADDRGVDAIDALLDILVEDHAYTSGAIFGMSQEDVSLALSQPWVSVDNDSQGTAPDGILGQEHPHPRAYGTFPRVLRKYVREDGLLTLEEAIRKFTSLPAAKMRLTDRGTLAPGKWADLVVFDPDSVRDLATFEEPNQLSVGMDWVLVNGVPVIANGEATDALPGRVLRGPGYRGAS
jgi:N-acyl-D-amino-acid deacylase